jgi:hypothetical protein
VTPTKTDGSSDGGCPGAGRWSAVGSPPAAVRTKHYDDSMMRAQIQIDEESYERLRRVAQRQQRSIADCIREGIELVVRNAEAADDSLASIAGRWTPRPLSDLKPHDAGWADAITGEPRR